MTRGTQAQHEPPGWVLLTAQPVRLAQLHATASLQPWRLSPDSVPPAAAADGFCRRAGCSCVLYPCPNQRAAAQSTRKSNQPSVLIVSRSCRLRVLGVAEAGWSTRMSKTCSEESRMQICACGEKRVPFSGVPYWNHGGCMLVVRNKPCAELGRALNEAVVSQCMRLGSPAAGRPAIWAAVVVVWRGRRSCLNPSSCAAEAESTTERSPTRVLVAVLACASVSASAQSQKVFRCPFQ